MKLEKLVGERFKERPADCTIDSHALMVRGGYIKNVANGIYSLNMPLRRITRKIEQIIREEMDKIDGQEVLFPVVLPASLWQESGRYDKIEHELARFNDRHKVPYVLGMTHEEAAVQLVREYGQSYARYPFMIYQVQTKFRDEMRPRGGLIRVREFTMKDAYSFHTSQEDLEQYYDRAHKAYERIFARCGLPQVISVVSDSGMMGGSVSHEFMFITAVGEDSIAVCGACDYRSNMEAAVNVVKNVRDEVSAEMELVHTPNFKTIDEVCGFLKTTQDKCCKAVVYRRADNNALVVIFLRGDFEINETKVRNFLGCEVFPADSMDDAGLCFGYIGPNGLNADVQILFDVSLKDANNLVCGGNKDEYHYIGFDIARDVAGAEFHDFAKIQDGGICPKCGKAAMGVKRGIELGNIFQLGTKYTEAMSMTYTDQDGGEQYPIMGCYGIGVERTAASVCEEYNDDYGPIWPISIAPWQVHLCAIRSDNEEVAAMANGLYKELTDAGVEVIFDDRNVSAGNMFSDADLLGVPVRVIVSPKTVGAGVVEVATRDKELKENVAAETAIGFIKDLVARKLAECDK